MKLSFEKLMQRKKDVVDQLTSNVEMLLTSHQINIISGRGVLKNNKTVGVSTEEGKQDINL